MPSPDSNQAKAITHGVRVEVESEYVPDQSDPENHYYFFAYHIRIANDGPRSIQVLSRHWVITDANGEVNEVQGLGVVGEQPALGPGDVFEYTSFCPLSTPVGTMQGTYQVVDSEQEMLEVAIPTFGLIQEKDILH